jgi:hypothetical protein
MAIHLASDTCLQDLIGYFFEEGHVNLYEKVVLDCMLILLNAVVLLLNTVRSQFLVALWFVKMREVSEILIKSRKHA